MDRLLTFQRDFKNQSCAIDYACKRQVCYCISCLKSRALLTKFKNKQCSSKLPVHKSITTAKSKHATCIDCAQFTINIYVIMLCNRVLNFHLYISQYLTKMMHKICFTISFISCFYMFRAHVLIIRRSKLHYTASGIIILKQVSALKLLKYNSINMSKK